MASQKHQTNTEEKEKISIYVAFFTCALTLYMVFIILLSGAQDILAGTRIQTSWVLMADTVPYFIVPLLFPFFAKRVPYLFRFVAVFVLFMTAFLSLGLIHNVDLKLCAVALASLGTGTLDTSLVALTFYFKPSVLSCYAAGTGAGFLVGPVFYTAMTTWFCVSPSITLLVLGPCSAVILIAYYFIHKEINSQERHLVNKQEVVYTKLETSGDANESDSVPEVKDNKKSNDNSLTFKEKLSAAKNLIALIGVPLFLAFLSEYIFFQSVITTMAYPSSPFQPRDHYQYYLLALMTGEVLGRSSRAIIGGIKPTWLYTPTRLLLWVLVGLEMFHLMFFLVESWYRFLPGVGIPIFLCFTAGVIIGLIFVNGLALVSVSFEGCREREFVLTMALFPMTFGAFIASIVGLHVEPILREHCITIFSNSEYCFTRSFNLKKSMEACLRKI